MNFHPLYSLLCLFDPGALLKSEIRVFSVFTNESMKNLIHSDSCHSLNIIFWKPLPAHLHTMNLKMTFRMERAITDTKAHICID